MPAKKVYNFQWSDGGRDRRQANDCSVRSLALACNVLYVKAFKTLQAVGRKPNQGVDVWQMERALDLLQIAWVKCPYKSTPEQFMATYPIGRYVLNMKEHFSAVVDGCMFDTNSHFGKLIYSYYHII